MNPRIMGLAPYYADDTLTLLQGDARTLLSKLDAGSVDCCVTSPPYYGLRDYGGHPDQIGLEASPSEYVAQLAEVFAEVHRVLADDGTLWLNLGDSYAAHQKGSGGRNPGDLWQIATRPYPEAHFATFPVDLPRRCRLAGCRPGGTVLDPFAGSGTALLAAQQLGRRAVGVEVNRDYLALALKRCQDAPLFADGEEAIG